MLKTSSWIRKSVELTLKYSVRFFRSVPDSLTKILWNLLQNKIYSHLSRNLVTLASVTCYLPFELIKCTSLGGHLLLSLTGASWESNGALKFFSKTEDCQKYRSLIPDEMINDDIKLSTAYKTYLDYATRKVPPKKERKFKKPASPKLKTVPTSPKEPTQKGKRVKRLAKKATTTPSTGVVIRDTPNKSVSNKITPTKTDRGKGIELLSDAALLEDAQLTENLCGKSKKETPSFKASGSCEGVILKQRFLRYVDSECPINNQYKLKEEAEAENQEFFNQVDSTMKTIIKEQVKAQVSKIMPQIEMTPPLDQIEGQKEESQARMLNHQKAQSQRNQSHLALLKALNLSLKGREYPFDLGKPLLLIEDRGRQVVPTDYFINNDLEYLKGGSSSRKYVTSTTRTKAAKYDNIKGIEDIVPTLWSPVKVAYNKHDILGTYHWGPKQQRFYAYACHWKSPHDVYSKRRIIMVTSVKVMRCQNQRDLPRDIPLDSVVVPRYEKRSKSKNKGRVPTEMELVLEQTQQGTSYEVPVFPMMEAARRGRVRFIAACSYSTDIYKDFMKAQVHVSRLLLL
ncbi:hypothetical protein Tco_0988297 [Tanacetum coccineum]|uniref:Uncharacterized protein n=1 Tax=Tanacetum coccineum TaxID=301880 RepID=A0ABQ5EQY8_9ASTR